MSKIAQTISAILIILFTFCTNLQAGNRKGETVYAFAYGTCFNDSIIYLSTVEKLDSANINPKTKLTLSISLIISTKEYTHVPYFSTKAKRN